MFRSLKWLVVLRLIVDMDEEEAAAADAGVPPVIGPRLQLEHHHVRALEIQFPSPPSPVLYPCLPGAIVLTVSTHFQIFLTRFYFEVE